MTPQQVIDFYGAGSIMRAVSKDGSGDLPVTRQSVYNWISKGKVPPLWQAWIERDTAGVLKADRSKP